MPFFKGRKTDKKSDPRAGLTPADQQMHAEHQNKYNGSSGTPRSNSDASPAPTTAPEAHTPQNATPRNHPANTPSTPKYAASATPTLTPPPHKGVYQTAQPAQTPTRPPPGQKPKLVFHTQLAHGSPNGKIEGFTSVKQLYEKIGEAFAMPAEEILFCTLNTYKVDMDYLLGGQIGLDDIIFAHIKGETKKIEVMKTHPALGLTITDNGAGFAFIKRIKEGSTMEQTGFVGVGDHVSYINDVSMVKRRHFEVAKILKELPVGENFSMVITQPRRAFDKIAPRQTKQSMQSTPSESNVKTGKATLRLRNTGPATLQAVPTVFETRAVEKIDDLLESYMGIRDEELAETLVDLFKGKTDFTEFTTAVGVALKDFEFPEDIIFDIWGAISDAKAGRI